MNGNEEKIEFLWKWKVWYRVNRVVGGAATVQAQTQ